MGQDHLLAVVAKAWNRRFYQWRGYALALTGNLGDAEDVVQEAVLRTLRARPDLPTERDAYYYVLTAVRSAAYRLVQRRGRLRPVDELRREPRSGPASSALRQVLDAEAKQETEALLELVMEAMDTLRPEQRQAVELLILRDEPLKLREVAEIQSAPISTVHSRLKAALRTLGESLEDAVRDETEEAEE